jgi:hypothetical protein
MLDGVQDDPDAGMRKRAAPGGDRRLRARAPMETQMPVTGMAQFVAALSRLSCTCT